MFVFMEQRVSDFDIWKEAFDEHQAHREALGAIRHCMYRGSDDANEIFIAIEFDDDDLAHAFAVDETHLAAMREAGAVGEARISFREEHEALDY